MKRHHYIWVPFAILLFCYCTSSQKTIPASIEHQRSSIDLQALLPVDPNVIVGKLDNGLRYFIRVNHKPEKRADLRLVVNVGSVLEDDDQRGLAHFCEHMAFNGTKHFAKHELTDFLESIGIRFGPEVNAYTAFDETAYLLEVPTDSAEILEKAFLVLEDWAHNVTFDAEEIDKERGVIIEEWRLGRGAGARMLDQQLPILFKGSRYADRLTIGEKAILETFEHETLRRFYRDWYRPDLMAIIAVGDFDAQKIEFLIRKYFEPIPPIPNARERTLFPVPNHDETLIAIATDPEAAQTSVGLYFKKELLPEKTVGDYRRMVLDYVYDELMNLRLDELRQKADPPILFGFSGNGEFVRSKGVYYLSAGVEEDGLVRGLDAILTEAMRVKKHGFIQAELERVKKVALRGMERAFLERDKSESSRYASEYIRHFLTDEPIPGIEEEYALYKKIIPEIQLQEVNGLAQDRITDENRVILVNAPEKEGVNIPTENELLNVFDVVEQKDIEAYVDNVSEQPLLAELPVPGEIINETRIDTLDVTLWTLSNGMQIILKPTDFKNDEIIFTSFSPGGNSLIPDSQILPARSATTILTAGGVGLFDRIELQKKLAGKAIRVTPYISTLIEGIRGGASPRDVETMFQLIYLYFTTPRKDSTAFQSYKARLEGFLANRSAEPESAFGDTLQVTMAQYHHRARPWSNDMLNELDLELSYEIYKDRFADAGDFTFIFVGNFDPEDLKSLVQTYLGGLPVIHRNETWKDVGIRPPEGVIEKTVRKGIESKGHVALIFTGPYQWTRENNYTISSMVSVLQIKMREVLRESLGGTYGVDISSSQSKIPNEEYTIGIDFGCDPQRADELTQMVITQIDSLKKFGIGQTYIDKVTEAQIRQYETNLKENGYWLGGLYGVFFYNQDPLNIINYLDLVRHLSVQSVQKAAQQYFNFENYVKVVLLPEEGRP